MAQARDRALWGEKHEPHNAVCELLNPPSVSGGLIRDQVDVHFQIKKSGGNTEQGRQARAGGLGAGLGPVVQTGRD